MVRVVIDAGSAPDPFQGRRVLPASGGLLIALGSGEELDWAVNEVLGSATPMLAEAPTRADERRWPTSEQPEADRGRLPSWPRRTRRGRAGEPLRRRSWPRRSRRPRRRTPAGPVTIYGVEYDVQDERDRVVDPRRASRRLPALRAERRHRRAEHPERRHRPRGGRAHHTGCGRSRLAGDGFRAARDGGLGGARGDQARREPQARDLPTRLPDRRGLPARRQRGGRRRPCWSRPAAEPIPGEGRGAGRCRLLLPELAAAAAASRGARAGRAGERSRLRCRGRPRSSPPAAIDILEEGGLIDGKEYTGRRISLDFKDVEIADVLRLIAEVSDLNVIAGDEVTGQRDDPPGGRALGPGARRDPPDQGPRLHAHRQRAAHRADRRAQRRRRRCASRSGAPKEQLEDLVVKLQPVNYADVKDDLGAW